MYDISTGVCIAETLDSREIKMSTVIVFQQMLVIFILIAVGYGLSKKGLVTDSGSKLLSFLVVNVTNPAMILSSVFEENVSVTRQNVIIMILVTAIIYAVLVLLGWLLPKLYRIPGREQKYYNMMVVYANTGFIGIPLISAVLGTQALIYVTVFNIAFTLLFYTHGTRILLSDGERQKVTWKTFINIGTVSGLLALVFFWFRLRFPAVIEGSITTMGKATTFLSMTVLGVSLAQIPLRKIFSSVRLLLFVLARMLALPAVFCLILKQFLGGGLMINAVALMLAMPSANMPLMVAKQHGLETETLSRGIVLSTILSIVTITVISLII